MPTPGVSSTTTMSPRSVSPNSGIAGLKVAQADADVALNTLKTLEAAVSLQSQMLWSSSEFESLMEISPPELIPLDDEEMFQRFLDVSRELATS